MRICALVLAGGIIVLAFSHLVIGHLSLDALLTVGGIVLAILAGSLPDMHKSGVVEAREREVIPVAVLTFIGILMFSFGSYTLFQPSSLLLPLWVTFPALLIFDTSRRFISLKKRLASETPPAK